MAAKQGNYVGLTLQRALAWLAYTSWNKGKVDGGPKTKAETRPGPILIPLDPTFLDHHLLLPFYFSTQKLTLIMPAQCFPYQFETIIVIVFGASLQRSVLSFDPLLMGSLGLFPKF